jgi:hypothetical protein
MCAQQSKKVENLPSGKFFVERNADKDKVCVHAREERRQREKGVNKNFAN